MHMQVGEFDVSGIIITVPLLQFLLNSVFFKNQNESNAGNMCKPFCIPAVANGQKASRVQVTEDTERQGASEALNILNCAKQLPLLRIQKSVQAMFLRQNLLMHMKEKLGFRIFLKFSLHGIQDIQWNNDFIFQSAGVYEQTGPRLSTYDSSYT